MREHTVKRSVIHYYRILSFTVETRYALFRRGMFAHGKFVFIILIRRTGVVYGYLGKDHSLLDGLD